MIGRKEQQRRPPPQEQLRFPKTERIYPGDVRQFIRSEGIIRISFGQDPKDVNIDFDRFTPDKAAEERALRPFAEVLAPYVWAQLTHIGSQHAAPDQIGANAEVDLELAAEPVKNVMKSLLRQKIAQEKISTEMKSIVHNTGGIPEVHLGIRHPVAKNILTDLETLLQEAVEELERAKQRPTAR